MLHGVIWDFDGTIVDTETPQFEVWQAIFIEHKTSFAVEEWAAMVGTISTIDPLDLLEAKVGSIHRAAVYEEYGRRFALRRETMTLRPGVKALLDELRQRMIPSAIASSSSRQWIKRYLLDHDISRYFSAIVTAADVGVPKPDPGVYRLALSLMRIRADEAVAIEDSPHGVQAAQNAGIACLVVPNPSTKELEFPLDTTIYPDLQGVNVVKLREMVS